MGHPAAQLTARAAAWLTGCAAALLVPAAGAAARDVQVAGSAALLKAIHAAQPGDEIVLADGDYLLAGAHGADCLAPGTEAAPITVRAATPLGARIRSTATEGFYVAAPHWHFADLDLHGVCTEDTACEHAFHVVGHAAGFRLLRSRLVDFNAALKVNADGAHALPDDGLVEGNTIYNTHARATANPVAVLNIDNASRWVVRGNLIHDIHKGGGDHTSYAAFDKGGATAPVFERNLVICSLLDTTGGIRVGLSFGGGGMDRRLCAPAWDDTVPCDPEISDGVMRNNVIANCSDVGIYLNRARNTTLLHNTLIATAGIDVRFPGATAVAHGNVLSGRIRRRDGGQFAGNDNLQDVTEAAFAVWYRDPLRGDLRHRSVPAALIGKGGTGEVADDFCGRPRGAEPADWGALQESAGDCAPPWPWQIPAAP
jgi:parallel beta-helix repeat protein